MKSAFPIALLCLLCNLTILRAATNQFELREGGIIRGSQMEKKIALEFTAGDFAEGGPTILDELAKRKIKAAFFCTGAFFRKPEHNALAKRIIAEGHYLGPHSDTHPLLCPWSGPKKTLVTKEFFQRDLETNLQQIEQLGVKRSRIKYFIPPYEWYNEEIVAWTRELGLTLINFSPGTRSTADYTEEDAKNFVSSQVIYDSILRKEKENGLNGFMLLLHMGAGPKRTDKMYRRLPELLNHLQGKGYQFVRIDELLRVKPTAPN
jgi:endoglucanase